MFVKCFFTEEYGSLLWKMERKRKNVKDKKGGERGHTVGDTSLTSLII